MKRSITLIAFFLAVHALQSQTGVGTLEKKSGRNLEAIVSEAESEFEGMPVKGSYKRLKRAEHFLSDRIAPNGDLFNYTRANFDVAEELRLSGLGATGNWQPLGPFHAEVGVGRIICITVVDADTWYVGTAGGGLWKTDVAGIYFPGVEPFDEPWVPLTDNMPVLSVSGVCVDPLNTDEIYMLTGDGDWSVANTRNGSTPVTPSMGIFKSTDGGETWVETSVVFDQPELINVNKMVMHPANSSVMYAATSIGLLRTTDKWDTYDTLLTDDRIYDIEFHPTNPNIVYIAAYGKFYRSIDGLVTITETAVAWGDYPPERVGIAVTPASPNMIYMVTESDRRMGGFYKSTNKGAGFTLIGDCSDFNLLGKSDLFTCGAEDGQGEYCMSIFANPDDANDVFVGGVSMYRSVSGGLFWSQTDEGSHVDQHAFVYNPFNDSYIIGNDGGIYVSSDGSTWENRNYGLTITQFYHLGVNTSYIFPTDIGGGAQDNGTMSGYAFNMTSFDYISGGDGFNTHFGTFDGETVCYSEVQNGKLLVSTYDEFFGWFTDEITPEYEIVDGEYQGIWDTPYEMNKNSNGELLAGYNSLYYNADGDDEWFTAWNIYTAGAASYDPDDRIYNIAWNRENSNYVAFHIDKGLNTDIWMADMFYIGVIMVDPELCNWRKLPYMGADSLNVSDLQFASIDTINQLIATVSGYRDGEKVFLFDGDSAWTNISYNLPNVPALCSYNDEFGIYVGMDVGVFFLYHGDSVWTYHSEGLPTVPVTEIEVVNSLFGKEVYCSTYGRGIWKSEPAPPNRITRYYVDLNATGAETGENWTDAFNDVQQAIDAAIPGDTIWVAQGTYFPTASYYIFGGAASRLYTFIVDQGTVILGGFNGTETQANERDPELYPTVLSGDIGLIGTATDNSYHVLTILNSSKNSVIDGFTIRDGYSNGSSSYPALRKGGAVRLIYNADNYGRPIFNHCNFTNNYAIDLGGAVYIEQFFESALTTTFINTSFRNNSSGGSGGAISLDASGNTATTYGYLKLTVDTCWFDANDAGYGSGIYNDAGDFGTIDYKILNTTFTNNKNDSEISGSGGAIFNDGDNGGTIEMEIEQCIFIDNDAPNSGGAIYSGKTGEGYIDLKVTDCQIDSSSGYAIYAGSGNIDMQIHNVTFNANSGSIQHVGSSTDLVSTGAISNCQFTNNSGYQVYLNASNSFTGSPNKYIDYTIDSCTFTNNSNTAVYCTNYSAGTGPHHAEYVLTNSTITGNSNTAVYHTGGNITAEILSCNFISNSGTNGGAIYMVGSSSYDNYLTVDNCQFDENYSSSNGAAVYASNVDELYITNSDFTGNDADNGGAVYNTATTGQNYIFQMSNCQINNNTSLIDGGGIYLNASDPAEMIADMNVVAFDGNQAADEGGAAYFNASGDLDLTISTSTFSNNQAEFKGGAWYVYSSGEADTMDIVVTDCSFDFNSATINTSSSHGGAIFYWTAGFINADFSSTDFTGNYAISRGGAVFVESNSGDWIDMTFDSCHFVSNESDVQGGAISLHDGGSSNGTANLYLANSEFTNNNAQSAGGALSIFTLSTTETITANMDNCLFEANSSNNGSGAIHLSSDAAINGYANDCRFINNTAVLYGGAVRMYAYSTETIDFDFNRCLFDGNTSQDVGGAFYIQTDQSGIMNSAFDNCIFSNNEADRGGAVYTTASNSGALITLPFTNSTIANNNATIETGGVYATRTSTPVIDVDMVNTILYGNTDPTLVDNRKQAYLVSGTSGSMNNCIAEDAIPAGYTDAGSNQFVDPLFIDALDIDGSDDLFPTSDDGFSLLPGSPAINAGAVVAVAEDITGLTRPQDLLFDIGAYEIPGCINPELPVLSGDDVICAGETTELSVASGALNSATEWKWYASSCGGVLVGTGNTINVSPTITTTYYVRGEGGCVATGSCATYTVMVNAAPANVTGLKANLITSCSIKYKWNAVVGATNYTVEYKLNSSPTWLSAGTVSVTNKNITGLTAGTSYDVRVRANNAAGCAGNWAQKLNTVTYIYDIPNNPTESLLAATSVTLNWTAPSCGSVPVSYQVQYKLSTSPTWINVPGVAGLSYALAGLSPSTAYNWKVRANYAGGNSGYSKTRTFTTLPLKLDDGISSIVIHPNPGDGLFNLFISLQEITPLFVEVKNDIGETVYSSSVSDTPVEQNMQVDLRSQPAGIYFVVVHHSSGTETLPVVKQ